MRPQTSVCVPSKSIIQEMFGQCRIFYTDIYEVYSVELFGQCRNFYTDISEVYRMNCLANVELFTQISLKCTLANCLANVECLRRYLFSVQCRNLWPIIIFYTDVSEVYSVELFDQCRNFTQISLKCTVRSVWPM